MPKKSKKTEADNLQDRVGLEKSKYWGNRVCSTRTRGGKLVTVVVDVPPVAPTTPTTAKTTLATPPKPKKKRKDPYAGASGKYARKKKWGESKADRRAKKKTRFAEQIADEPKSKTLAQDDVANDKADEKDEKVENDEKDEEPKEAEETEEAEETQEGEEAEEGEEGSSWC